MLEITPWTGEDFDALFELLDVRSRLAFGVSEQEPAFVRQALELPGTDSWVARKSGVVAGLATLAEDQDATVDALAAQVGDALLAEIERRARERGFEHVAITAVPEDKPLYALVQRHGLTLEREVWRMWRSVAGDLPEPDWPAGVAVRTYTDDDGERVHTLLDAAYSGWDGNYISRSHQGWLAFMTGHDEFDPALWFLVERDGELVGCSLHWQEHRGDGWVKDIVVVESERGRGLGKALLYNAFRAYAERGAARVGLKVDSTNPTGALQLYASVGFVTDRRYGIWIDSL